MAKKILTDFKIYYIHNNNNMQWFTQLALYGVVL